MDEFGISVKRILTRVLPRNRFGDRFFCYVDFILRNNRLPSDRILFNDVLYRLKTSDEILNPLRVFISDKEHVKLYVRAVAGEKYNVPTLGIIKDPRQVDCYDFPADCCIKPTQASGRVILRRNSAPLDLEEIKSWFSVNYYDEGREANYKMLIPKVIVEPLIFGTTNVSDYKFFCLNGVVKLIQVDVDRYIDHKRMIFDAEWKPQDFSTIYPRANTVLEKPENFEEMLEVAQKLADGFGFVRIDLYSDGKTCLVGEITNCHGNAGTTFIPSAGEEIASAIIFG